MTEVGDGALLRAIYGNPFAQAIMWLLFANVLTKLAVSLFRKSYSLGEIIDWLFSKAVPYLLGAGAIQLVLLTVPTELLGEFTEDIGKAVWLFGIAALLGNIIGDLMTLGLPVPEVIRTRKRAENESPPTPRDPV